MTKGGSAESFEPSVRMDMDLSSKYLLVQVTHIALKLYGSVREGMMLPRFMCTGSALIVLSPFLFSQALKLYEETIGLKLIIDVLPAAMTSFICLLSMLVAELNGKRVKCPVSAICYFIELIVCLQSLMDWNEKRNEAENEIKHDYIQRTKSFILYYMLVLLVVIIIGMTWVLRADILDFIIPLNESRPKELIFRGEYFFDEEKYYYPILLFELTLTFCVLTVVSIVQSIFAVLVLHACSMFAVAGHRLENIATVNEAVNNKREYENIIANRIISCIRGHLSALQFSYSVHTTTTLYLSLSLVETAIGLTFLLAAMSVPEFRNIKTMVFACGLCGQFFFLSYLGQKLMDTSVQLPSKFCNAQWYECPPRLQKMLVLLIMRSHKPSSIVMTALFVLSLENFCMVANSAVSYCMVLRQFQ